MISLKGVEHAVFDLESRQVFVAVNHEHRIIIEKSLNKHVILGNVDEVGPASKTRSSIIANVSSSPSSKISY